VKNDDDILYDDVRSSTERCRPTTERLDHGEEGGLGEAAWEHVRLSH